MTEQQLARQARRRLAILRHAEEVTGNVASTCRYYGISRQCFYTWQRRYESRRNRRSAGPVQPANSARWRPTPTSSARSSTCASTTTSGPRKISMYLKRYHDDLDLQLGGVADPQTTRTQPASRQPAPQDSRPALETLREAAPRPPGPDRRQVHRPDPRSSSQALLPVHRDRRLHPAPGAADLPPQQPAHRDPVPRLRPRQAPVPGRSRSKPTTAPSSNPTFHWHVLDRGIRHVYIKPRTPRLNGKVERSHRIDAEEFYRMLDHGVIIDDANVFNDKLQEWEDFYNFHRPHGGLDGQTPYERLRQKTTGT